MEKKILVPCLDVIMIAFFAKKYTVKDHISVSYTHLTLPTNREV